MLKVAIGEYDTGWQDPEGSLARAVELIEKRARAGARLVVLPETSPSGFTMSSDYAEPQDGKSMQAFAAAARNNEVYVLAGIATRRNNKCYNTAVLFGPDGMINAAYDKQKLFSYAGEDRVFSAGSDPVIFDIDGVRATVFICYDLRFPLLFKEVCPYADLVLIIANWPEQRDKHWQVLTQARAIENQVYVIAVNRCGEGGGLRYKGGASVAFQPCGEPAPRSDDSCNIVMVDPGKVSEVRAGFPVAGNQSEAESPFGPFPRSWRASR